MSAYFYPTEDGWFENLLSEWKNSGLPRLCFPFYKFSVKTLPTIAGQKPYWMYLYFSENRTEDELLRGVVQYRVRVIQHAFEAIADPGAFTRTDAPDDRKVWFISDLVEEIRNTAGGYLRANDFEHPNGVKLTAAIRTSIAPVKRIVPLVTVQSTAYQSSD